MEKLTRQDLEKLDVPRINAKIAELRKELFDLRIKKATSGMEKPHLLKVLRQNIARLMTFKTIRTRE